MPREIGWSRNANLLYRWKQALAGENSMMSREIGQGIATKLLEDIVDENNCQEVCTGTTTTTSTTSTTTTTTTTTTQSPALLCAENWETSYIPVSGTLAVAESDATGDCEVYTVANYGNKSNIVKRDASANIVWQTTVSAAGPCTDDYAPIKIVAVADGSSYVLKKDALFKLDSSGALVWYKNYNIGTNNFVEFVSFAVSNAGFIYVLGKRDTNVLLPPPSGQAEPFYSPVVGKFDATTGALVAEQTYYLSTFPDDNLNQPPTDIKVDGAGNIIFVHHNSLFGSQWQQVVVKIDSSLALVWTKVLTYGVYGYNAVEMAIDASDNIILASTQFPASMTPWTGVTKLSSAGAALWAVEVLKGGNQLESLKSVTTDSAGNIYVCGSVTVGGAQCLAKLTSAGALSYVMELSAAAPTTLQMVDLNANNTIVGDKLYASVVSNVTAPATYQSELIKMNPASFPVGTYGNFTYANQTGSYAANALAPVSNTTTINLLGDAILASIAGTCAATGSSIPVSTYTKTVL